MRVSPSRGAAFCVIGISLQLCSCKEHAAVFAEKAALEAELQQARAEVTAYDTKTGAVGQTLPNARAALEMEIKAADKTCAELTQEISDLNAKSARLDAGVKKFRPIVESYKAKFLP